MKIKYFAWIKDITNKNEEIINKDLPKDLEQLKKNLIKIYPELEKHILNNNFRYALNREYVSTNFEIKINDEVAIFPPVSGG